MKNCFILLFAPLVACAASPDARRTASEVGSKTAYAVVAPGTRFDTVSLTGLGGCGVTNAGAVACWGYAGAVTQPPADLVGVKMLATADDHACAVTAENGLRCWGENRFGETEAPAELGPVKAVSTAWDHTCVVTTAGTLRCWGAPYATGRIYSNQGGYRLDNPLPPAKVPAGLVGVVAVSAGLRADCAILAGGALRCWKLDLVTGEPPGEPLADDIDGNGKFLARVPSGLAGVKRIEVADRYACAEQEGARTTCWGYVVNSNDEPVYALRRLRLARISAGAKICGIAPTTSLAECRWFENEKAKEPLKYWKPALALAARNNQNVCGIFTGGRLECLYPAAAATELEYFKPPFFEPGSFPVAFFAGTYGLKMVENATRAVAPPSLRIFAEIPCDKNAAERPDYFCRADGYGFESKSKIFIGDGPEYYVRESVETTRVLSDDLLLYTKEYSNDGDGDFSVNAVYERKPQ